jgi:hypothetical protein
MRKPYTTVQDQKKQIKINAWEDQFMAVHLNRTCEKKFPAHLIFK